MRISMNISRNLKNERKRKDHNILLNILLNLTNLQHASILRLLDRLLDKLDMLDCLSTLHDADDGRLGLVLPVLGNPFVGFFILLFGFFELDLVDLDADLLVLEGGVEGECVCRVDVFSFWMFFQDTLFAAGERLEGADQFTVGWGDDELVIGNFGNG